MWDDLQLILRVLKSRIIGIGNQQGTNQEYIQGQLNEARHQVEILGKKLQRSNKHGF